MAVALTRTERVVLARVDEHDLVEAQRVFAASADYHRRVSGKAAPDDAARRCFERPAPKPKHGLKTFKYFLAIMPVPGPEEDTAEIVGIIDIYVGYPRYDIATMPAFLIAPAWQRKGLGRAAIASLATWVQRDHPAVKWIDTSITDDNLIATQFLMDAGFQRTDTWYPIEVEGKTRRVIRLEKPLGR